MGMMSLPFLILAFYLRLRPKKKYSVLLGVSLAVLGLGWSPPGLQVRDFAPLAEVGQDQSRVVGGNTRPSLPHTSHIFDI